MAKRWHFKFVNTVIGFVFLFGMPKVALGLGLTKSRAFPSEHYFVTLLGENRSERTLDTTTPYLLQRGIN
jgi:hypothetical protein